MNIYPSVYPATDRVYVKNSALMTEVMSYFEILLVSIIVVKRICFHHLSEEYSKLSYRPYLT